MKHPDWRLYDGGSTRLELATVLTLWKAYKQHLEQKHRTSILDAQNRPILEFPTIEGFLDWLLDVQEGKALLEL